MLKKKIIAAALALSLVLAGTGYAYWTDSLNITTKATTGELEVKFLDLGLLAQYQDESKGIENKDWTGWSIIDGIGNEGYVDSAFFREATSYKLANHNTIATDKSLEDYAKRTEKYNDVKFTAEYDASSKGKIDVTIEDYKAGVDDVGDKINISVENIYPGFAQAFRTDIANTGNIAAKLSEIVVDVTTKSSDSVKQNIGIALYMQREVDGAGDVFKLAKQFKPGEIFKVGGVDFVRLSAIGDPSKFEKLLNDTLLQLPSKNRMDLFLGVAMDPDAKNETMNGSVDFTIDLNWDQFNVDKEIKATNILDKQNR